jgi:ATP-dependent Lhr-like helicase
MRQMRRRETSGQWVSVSAADPLNLAGIVTPGPRVAALTGNRLIYRDGVALAAQIGGKVEILASLDPPTEWEARKRLIRSASPLALADLA